MYEPYAIRPSCVITNMGDFRTLLHGTKATECDTPETRPADEPQPRTDLGSRGDGRTRRLAGPPSAAAG